MKRLAALIAIVFAAVAQSVALAAAPIEFDRVWARATAPGASVGAVYGTVIAAQDDAIVSATTSAAERVEIHATSNVDGVMKMRPVTTVELPAGKRIDFAPGGLHVMLIGLREPLQADQPLTITFVLRNAAPITIPVRVVPPGHEEHTHSAH